MRMTDKEIKDRYTELQTGIKGKKHVRLRADGSVTVNGKPCKNCGKKLKQ